MESVLAVTIVEHCTFRLNWSWLIPMYGFWEFFPVIIYITSCFPAKILKEIFTISTLELVRVYGTIPVMNIIDLWLLKKGQRRKWVQE